MNTAFSTAEPLIVDNITDYISPVEDHGPFIPITKEMYLRFLYAVKVVLTPALCTLGLLGNIAGLVILRKGKRLHNRNFCIYIGALMTSYVIRCLDSLTYSIPHIVNIYDYYLANFLLQHMRVACVYVEKVVDYFSASIMLVMSFERLLALIKPLTFREMCLTRYPRCIVLACSILFSISMLPYALCCSVLEFVNSDNKTEFSFHERSAYWKNFMDTYAFIASLGLYCIAPFFILLINVAIPVAFYRYNSYFTCTIQAETQRKAQQTRLTAMVFCIVTLYLLLSIPRLFAICMDFANDEYSFSGRYQHVFYFFIQLGYLMSHLNTICDSFIFIFMSQRLHYVLKILCCKHCASAEDSILSQLDTVKQSNDKLSSISETVTYT